MKKGFLEKVEKMFLPWLPSLVLLFSVIFVVSCQMTVEGVGVLDGDIAVPVLLDFQTLSENEIRLSFSEEVSLSDILIFQNFGTVIETNSIYVSGGKQEEQTSFTTNNNYDLKLTLKENGLLLAGESYVLSGTASDTNGNSLSFQIPFQGYNGRVPELVLSEIRTGYSKPKVEFIELYALTEGNLAGVTLYTANDDKFGEFTFPQAEVKAGEYIVVHFRTLEDEVEKCINEVTEELNVATATEACDTARDFWLPQTKARIGGKTDVVLLRERSGGRVLDAVIYAESSLELWKNDAFKKAINVAVEHGAWHGGTLPQDVICGDGLTTVNRTVSRQNIDVINSTLEAGLPLPKNDTSCWIVTTTSSKVSGATPGYKNSSAEYTP